MSMNSLVLRRRERLIIVRRKLRDSENPFETISEERFVELYRFPKHLCVQFLDKIKPLFYTTERISGIPVHLRFLCALRFFATGSFQRAIGQDFLSCMSQTSVSRSIHEVADIINEVSNQYVYFPGQQEESAIKQDFYQLASFPGIVGLIDGSHIKITSPSSDIEYVYYCRKGGHSINVLIVCDFNCVIRYANAKFPGTSHDAYIWRHSTLQEHLRRKHSRGERNFWLLGDSGFPLQPWLITPINSSSNQGEERFNIAHKKTRCIVERCIGILKSRFRCLSKDRVLCYDPVKAGRIINACVVLHNVLLKANVPLLELSEEAYEQTDEDHIMIDDEIYNTLSEGRRVRQIIVDNNFTNF